MRIFLFLRSSPHAPILGLGSWNSNWKWDSQISKGPKNFSPLILKLGEILASKKIFPTPSPNCGPRIWVIFLQIASKWNCLKALKVSKESFWCISRYFAFHMLPQCPVVDCVKTIRTESRPLLLHTICDINVWIWTSVKEFFLEMDKRCKNKFLDCLVCNAVQIINSVSEQVLEVVTHCICIVDIYNITIHNTKTIQAYHKFTFSRFMFYIIKLPTYRLTTKLRITHVNKSNAKKQRCLSCCWLIWCEPTEPVQNCG